MLGHKRAASAALNGGANTELGRPAGSHCAAERAIRQMADAVRSRAYDQPPAERADALRDGWPHDGLHAN